MSQHQKPEDVRREVSESAWVNSCATKPFFAPRTRTDSDFRLAPGNLKI
jgi:hypothetical protein